MTWTRETPNCRHRARRIPGNNTMTTKYTPAELALARRIWADADDNGIVSGLGIAPQSRPELHGSMLMGSLFELLTGKEWDADFMARRFAK